MIIVFRTFVKIFAGLFFTGFCLLGFTLFSCRTAEKHTSGEEDSVVTKPQNHAGNGVRTVSLIPYWVTSAQFAGYYVGIEKGIFLKHGIDLKILPFNPFTPTDSIIREGIADFSLLWLVNAIELREKGIHIVNIGQLSKRSSLMLITKKSSGIKSVREMNGKRAGIWAGYDLQPKTLFYKYHVDVKIVPIGSSNSLFLLDAVDITNANWFDEYHSILNNGYNENELNTFFFADLGLNFLEDGIYCLAEKTRKDPKLCTDFVNAALESWKYAFDHQEEAIDIVIRRARKENCGVNRTHQRWMLSHYKELYIPNGQKNINTVLLSKDYDNIANILLHGKFIKSVIPYDSFYFPYKSLMLQH